MILPFNLTYKLSIYLKNPRSTPHHSPPLLNEHDNNINSGIGYGEEVNRESQTLN